MDISIHQVKGISVFRENGFLKLSIIDDKEVVHGINLHGCDDKTPLMRDSANRVPCSVAEFGLEIE